MTTFTEPDQTKKTEIGTAMHVLDVFLPVIWNAAKTVNPNKIRFKNPREARTIRRFFETLGYAMGHYSALTNLLTNYLPDEVQDLTLEKAAALVELFEEIKTFDASDIREITQAVRLNVAESQKAIEPFDFGKWLEDSEAWEEVETIISLNGDFEIYNDDGERLYRGNTPATQSDAETLFRLLGIGKEADNG